MEADGTIEAMLALRDEGKVRFLGMSGTLPNLPDHIAMGVFDVFQIPYSARPARARGADHAGGREPAPGVLIRGGAARGAPAEDKGWAARPIGLEPRARRSGAGRRRGVEELLDGMSRHGVRAALHAQPPGLSSTIVGTSRLDSPARRTSRSRRRARCPADLYEEAKRRIDSVGRVGGYGSPPPTKP